MIIGSSCAIILLLISGSTVLIVIVKKKENRKREPVEGTELKQKMSDDSTVANSKKLECHNCQRVCGNAGGLKKHENACSKSGALIDI